MNGNSKVSIITPSFNRADVIHETAISIFHQTYPFWEWVITDDGSTDESWELLQKYAEKDSRVKIFQRNREPKGACVCRNISIEHATGDYLLFLDSDDLMASFCLEQRVNTMAQYPEADFVVFPMLMFKHKPDDLRLLWNVDSPLDDIERILLGDPVCQGTGTLWRKQSFVKSGMWNEKLLLWQDVELHLRVLLQGLQYIKCLDLRPDVFLRISDISLSRTQYHSLPKFLSRLQVLKATTEAVLQKNMMNKYKVGIQHMFTDLFMNATGNNYHRQVQELLELQKSWFLFTPTEQRNLKYYAFVRKFRFYKIPLVQKMSLKNLSKGLSSNESSLNRIYYTKNIQL